MNKNNHYTLWVDMINPSDVFFFKALISDLQEYDIYITLRDRSETIDLANYFGLRGQIIGTDFSNPLKKSVNMVFRTINLMFRVPKFDASLSFENAMCVLNSKIKKKISILYCDNDLKLIAKKALVQDIENNIKKLADYIIIPNACYNNFRKVFGEERLISFDGYKEDVYIADYRPNPKFLNTLPFEKFIVIRPEALTALYVRDSKSIVPELLASFVREDINVVYLPREKDHINYAKGLDIFMPKKALNGLDLCWYANAVLTGSGTLAREAACMGTTAVSFFPGKILLSVDKQLINEGKLFHSRNVDEIVNYVISHSNSKTNNKLEDRRCKKVKRDVVKKTRELIEVSLFWK